MIRSKEDNPIRLRILAIKEELKHLGRDIRKVKNILANEFPFGIARDPELYNYRFNQIMLNNLRDKYRYLHLIYGFIRGKRYVSMERRIRRKIDWDMVFFWSKHYMIFDELDFKAYMDEYNSVKHACQ